MIFAVWILGLAAANGVSETGDVTVTGELATWHDVTLTVDGPYANERDASPNPFLDYRLTVRFQHESGEPAYVVPGYFAADGNAAETSAESGTKWRAHLSPDKPGRWSYRVSFAAGKHVALDPEAAGKPVDGIDGKSGTFTVEPSRRSGRDFRARGRLTYVGKRYLRFAGSGEFFLKAGPDAPETFLAYAEFDGTETKKTRLKTWSPHARDWRTGDPTWKDGKGKGILGALNYLASKGLNAFSFLTYNAGGDGDNVWPFVERSAKLHYDCSKLDQWQRVFGHAQSLGLYLHFKMQEQENDDNRKNKSQGPIECALDGGALGVERKLYCRELVARFGHALALNWNLGEENSQSAAEQRAMAEYLRAVDPYDHPIVVHTFPNMQQAVYEKLLGDQSVLTGASLQNDWSASHERTLHWVEASRRAGRPWVVANDEQGPARLGVPADPGYEGSDGKAVDGKRSYDLHDIRRATLWGTLMAGGAGVEYYFGYKLPQNDLLCEDYRSRDRTWDFCRHALELFGRPDVPFHEMRCVDGLVGNVDGKRAPYCFAKPGEIYLVYMAKAARPPELDLGSSQGKFRVTWFDPRNGGEPQVGTLAEAQGGTKVRLGAPPRDADEDWLAIVRAEAP